MTDVTDFTAAPQMLGYLYQSHFALLLCCRKLKDVGHHTVSLETLDDIVFETTGSPKELLQTKHTTRAGNITNASADLWKTLRIWALGVTNKQLPLDTVRQLFTVANAPVDSVPYLLREESRDIVKAKEILDEIANSPTRSATNDDCYRDYLLLKDADRLELLNTITVIDRAPQVTNIEAELKREFRLTVPEKHLDRLIDSLSGWWFRLIVQQLSKQIANIQVESLRVQISALTEDLIRGDLPLHMLAIPQAASYENTNFVKQLRLINTPAQSVSLAIENYERAYSHRGQWLRDFDISKEELTTYDNQLAEEWLIHFTRASQDLGRGDLRDEEAAGIRVYRWAESDADVTLRRCRERFLCRGSLQILADEPRNAPRIGWHQRYKELLH